MNAPKVCSIDGCEKPRRARGWCGAHYMRWYQHGNPAHPTGARPGPKPGPVNYWIAHHRVARARGRAVDHECQVCGGQARNWAYDNADPGELRHSDGRRYSLDPSHYIPLCLRCHKRFDAEARQRAGIPTKNPWDKRGRSLCGTRAAYKRGCRCDACRAVTAQSQAAYRARKRAEEASDA